MSGYTIPDGRPPFWQMTKRSKAPARVLAVVALAAGFVVVIVVLSSALGGDGSGTSGNGPGGGGGRVTRPLKPAKDAPKIYVVKNGDTLSAIAHETGVPVAAILRLNPEVDPQILISGEKLKLR